MEALAPFRAISAIAGVEFPTRDVERPTTLITAVRFINALTACLTQVLAVAAVQLLNGFDDERLFHLVNLDPAPDAL